MPVKLGGSGGGGGAGDTYTASTAVAGLPVENGRSYNLSNEGKLAPANTTLVSKATDPVPNSITQDSGSGMDYSHSIYGDRITPDGKATFHLITDAASPYRGIFYVSLDGGASNNGTTHGQASYGPMMYQGGYGGAALCSAYIKLLFEDDDKWYYSVWFRWKYSSSASAWYNSGHGFMLYKSNHEFTHANWYGYLPQYAAMGTSTSNQYDPRYDYSRQSKYFFETCRNKDIFVWTYGQYNMSDYGFSVGAVDTYRSSDAAYYGGTNMGLPKTTGAQFSNTTHRDNVTAQQHMPFFKVDDANGIFIAPYFCASGTNNGEHVFLKYSIAANHVITTSSEVLISGTDPAQGGGAQGHWIATSNPLIFYYLYMANTTALYYTKCTWNSDWTSATWGTQAYITLVGTAHSNGYGSTYWALDRDHPNMQNKHSVPEKELFFLTGANSAAKNTAVCSFPATGTPSFVGLTTLNNELGSVYGNSMIMQSMNKGSMMSIQHASNQESYGFACFYTDHFNPNFKKTTNQIAIAREAGDSGDTINIDLKTGDTASATLSTNFYLTKEGMSYPLDVEGAASTGLTTVIKSIQRGTTYGTNTTTTISSVDLDKSFLNMSVGPTNGAADNIGRGKLTNATTITFNVDLGYNVYYNWEVIEYV